jgi:hypothetical protein
MDVQRLGTTRKYSGRKLSPDANWACAQMALSARALHRPYRIADFFLYGTVRAIGQRSCYFHGFPVLKVRHLEAGIA